MGAEHTYIAKPWREEVYLQMDRYPHPVLGHELAHVVAGSFGNGPFRVAGSFGGLVPNPGLIEGVAVAGSPDDDDVTDLAWAKTMMDLGILPPMRRIFSLGFLGEASSKSYTESSMCGVFGVSGVPDAARLTYLGLYALQHRGQGRPGSWRWTPRAAPGRTAGWGWSRRTSTRGTFPS